MLTGRIWSGWRLSGLAATSHHPDHEKNRQYDGEDHQNDTTPTALRGGGLRFSPGWSYLRHKANKSDAIAKARDERNLPGCRSCARWCLSAIAPPLDGGVPKAPAAWPGIAPRDNRRGTPQWG